jgi:hypothetical protein
MTDKKKQRLKSVTKRPKTSLDALQQEVELIDKEIEEELSRRPPAKFGVLATEPEAESGQRLQEARRGAGLCGHQP